MAVMPQSWTERPLDKLETRFGQIDDRLDGTYKAMMQALVTMAGIMVAGLVTIVGIVATHF
jgi:hypothetical protein